MVNVLRKAKTYSADVRRNIQANIVRSALILSMPTQIAPVRSELTSMMNSPIKSIYLEENTTSTVIKRTVRKRTLFSNHMQNPNANSRITQKI